MDLCILDIWLSVLFTPQSLHSHFLVYQSMTFLLVQSIIGLIQSLSSALDFPILVDVNGVGFSLVTVTILHHIILATHQSIAEAIRYI